MVYGVQAYILEFILFGALTVSVVMNITLFQQRAELEIRNAELEYAEFERLRKGMEP